jgi:hypothetical protein
MRVGRNGRSFLAALGMTARGKMMARGKMTAEGALPKCRPCGACATRGISHTYSIEKNLRLTEKNKDFPNCGKILTA